MRERDNSTKPPSQTFPGVLLSLGPPEGGSPTLVLSDDCFRNLQKAVRVIAIKAIPSLCGLELAPFCLCDGKEIRGGTPRPTVKSLPATSSVHFPGNLIRASEKSMWLKQTLVLLVRLEVSQWERSASSKVF